MMRTSTAVFCTLASLTARELLLQARAVAVPEPDGYDAADQPAPLLPQLPAVPSTVPVLDPSPWTAAAGLPALDFAHTPVRASVGDGELDLVERPSPQPDLEEASVEWAISPSPGLALAPARQLPAAEPPLPTLTADQGGSPTSQAPETAIALTAAPTAAPPSDPAQAEVMQLPTLPEDVGDPPVAASFPDIQGHWAQAFIEPLAVRNIVRGFPDGSFRPDAHLTRAQFAAMVSSAFRQPAVPDGQPFVDVADDYWAAAAIAKARRMNFLRGYPQGQFNPEQAITRAEVLTALAAGLATPGQAGTTPLPVADLDEVYQDAAQIPPFARRPIAEATANQWVVNYPTVNLLRPAQFSTRAEAAALVHQSLVDQGVLPPIAASSPLRNYIVTVNGPIWLPTENLLEGVPPPREMPLEDALPEAPEPEVNPEDLREQYRLPDAAPIFEAIAPSVSQVSDHQVSDHQVFDSDAAPEDWFSSVSSGSWGWLYGF